MDEKARVLVGYATAAGSTAGIAERIAATLRTGGRDVVCLPVGPDLDPATFDVFVLGSAVHNMAWLQPALDFLARVPTSDDRPTWCFSVGGLDPHGPVARRMTDSELSRVEQGFPSGLRPRDHRLFRGIVDMIGAPLWARIFWRVMGDRPGDQRDWPAIEAWAQQIAAALVDDRATGRPGRR
jgi:menaquinone-dependent protoporphyrinogen oxidase